MYVLMSFLNYEIVSALKYKFVPQLETWCFTVFI